MKRFALLSILLLSTAAYAQDDAEAAKAKRQAEVPVPVPNPSPVPAATPTPTPAWTPPATPPAPIIHWTLDIDQGDLNIINQCVGELPYKIGAPFVQKMQSHLKPAP